MGFAVLDTKAAPECPNIFEEGAKLRKLVGESRKSILVRQGLGRNRNFGRRVKNKQKPDR